MNNASRRTHYPYRLPYPYVELLLALALLAALALALSQGTLPISTHTLLSELLSKWPPISSPTAITSAHLVLWHIRLPRALLAACIGALLALCGTVTQSLFRNPLADPSLIGISAGASAGASLAIAFGTTLNLATPLTTVWGISRISFGAAIGGLGAVLLVYRIATRQGVTAITTLLLAGLAVSTFVSSLTQLLSLFSDDTTWRRLSLWHLGNIQNATLTQVSLTTLILGGLLCFFLRSHRSLDALLLGTESAFSLGVKTQQLQRRLILAVAIGVGITVTFAGIIAFIGLMVPHCLRWFVGPTHKRLLISSALGGALLLVLSDTAARTVLAPHELPVGLLTTLLGAPFFILLLVQAPHVH
ncbi:MAG: iron ABC transporter permease [Gammaproteobacteria bacterium]